MKKTGFGLFILAFAVLAGGQQALAQQPASQPQQPPASLQQGTQDQLPPPPPQAVVSRTNLVEKVDAPTYSDVNCAGFITNQQVPEGTYITAGWDTPFETRFSEGKYAYLTGSGFQEGQQYSIIRKLRDPNRWEAFKGQHGAVAEAGQPYAEVGHMTIVQGGVRGNTAIGLITFACDGIVPHDLAIPYVERVVPKYKDPGPFDPFAPVNGKTTGRIILAKDWDLLAGKGRIVYLNIGADKGVKVGDYFHTTRLYSDIAKDAADSLTFKASTLEDTQALPNVPSSKINELPRRSLGNLMIVSVSPKSSTGIITFSLEDIKVGDGVEMFEPPPPPPPPAAVSTVPTINCTPNPATVKRGESSTITCDASSPDNHPLTFSYSTSAGRLTPRDNTAVLDTSDVQPGPVGVTGTVTDDRNQTASSTANVDVEAPPAAPTPTSQTVNFKRNSAYVDNKAKAILDGVALQLQQQADATAVVIGHSDAGERKTLAALRATNVKNYLVGKGIDPKRIETRTSASPSGTAEVWILPAGTTVPAEAAPAEPTPAPVTPAPATTKKRSRKKPATTPPPQ
ncbi:MAG TPA: OmpA family protein [Terriglobales bacterium]|nr:OmpA family protein [Terriglobales bacterium]